MGNTDNGKFVENSHKEMGGFSAQTYCIYLPKHPKEYDLDKILCKIDIEDNEAKTRFFDHLPFLHEMVHFNQFLGTTFGFDYARSMGKAYLAIDRGAPWNRVSFNESYNDPRTDLRGTLIDYNYFRKQISIQPSLINGPEPYKHTMRMMYLPHHIAVKSDGRSVQECWEEIRKIEGIIQPIIYANSYFDESTSNYVSCNAYALFEGFALNAEIRYTINAFPDLGKDDFFQYIAAKLATVPTICRMCHEIYLFRNDLCVNRMFIQLAALIDIALMYSPLLLHKIRPTSRRNEANQKLFITPFDMFVRACDAASNVTPIQSDDRHEAQRFQDDVCKELDIPSTYEMTIVALERCEFLGLTFDTMVDHMTSARRSIGPAPDYYIIAHFLSLRGRMAYGDGYFLGMQSPLVISTELNQKKDWITFVDTSTNRPWAFGWSEQISSVGIGSFLDEFLNNLSVKQCPLKKGKPFLCWTPEENLVCSMSPTEDPFRRTCPFPYMKMLVEDM